MLTRAVADESSSSETAPLAEAGATLKRQGQQLRQEARDEIQRFATQRKEEAGSFLKDVSNALDHLTSKLTDARRYQPHAERLAAETVAELFDRGGAHLCEGGQRFAIRAIGNGRFRDKPRTRHEP